LFIIQLSLYQQSAKVQFYFNLQNPL